ncbi:MAG: hypothetical protein GC160_11605 [Acidobacteria bacterium]|nr:hypothetical protein [Acidobacteriota bacterium]
MRFLLPLLLLLAACGGSAPEPEAQAPDPLADAGIFSRDNLMAWCIVPFDASKRGPKERAEMLERLGIKAVAYDYREEHIPSFDEEIAALREKRIDLAAWWCGGVDPRDPLSGSVKLAMDALRRNNESADLWVLLQEKAFEGLSQEEKVALTVQAIEAIAAEAKTIEGRVGLYNHGGWYGEPENQLAALLEVQADNVGMVYNFHHGQEQMERLPGLFAWMVPHLLAVNLNGMTPGGPMILPLGTGTQDRGMIDLVRESGYAGPIGILDHRPEVDAEESLRENLEGLGRLVGSGVE